jgi:hypothetical protein
MLQRIVLAAALLVFLPRLAAAQNVVRPRIAGPVDESQLTLLRGNTHPLARPQNDQGAAADSQPIRRMLLLLQRSPEQETALRSLLDEQQSSASPNYHQWLTPQQFGQQFGPADADVQAVTSWLQSHGFQVAGVSAGKTVIEFSGNAGQVRNAFHTEMHRYVANGQEHLANASDPQIPTALAAVVAGPVSLNNFPKKALNHVAGVFRKAKATGQVTPVFTFSNGTFCGPNPCNALGPGDFDKIYNVPSAFNGSGQTIAIVGDSEICTATSPDFMASVANGGCNSVDDVATFRSLFGLTAKSPNVILDGPDPGFNGDETEGDLDVQWSGAVAENATIDFVIAEDTEATFGTDLAAEYVVDNNLAPVVSESFGACEASLGTDGNNFESTLWEQAAAQGITAIVSAGDSGSDACDDPNTFPNFASSGNWVNGIASTPFNVALGGTDFDVTVPSTSGYQGTYWGPNTTVGGIADISAKSYIPETTWNDTCAQSLTGALTGCNPLTNENFLSIVAGGGGQSNCTQETANGDCTAFYAKPTWQGGPYVTGQASTDGSRDLPDVSLFAADGFISNSFYVICESDLDPGNAQCNLSTTGNPDIFDFVGVGGTSSAAPTFAGMMALVNQNMAQNHPGLSARQGNGNYVLYKLASNQSTSGLSCNSTTGPNPSCTFNDITRGNNSVPCAAKTFGCSNQGSTAPYGVLEEANDDGAPTGTLAFNTGTGFDLATGLGTVNATNLVTNWATAVGGFMGTTTTLCLSPAATTESTCVPAPITITHGSTVWVNAKVTPSTGSLPNSTSTAPENVALIGTFTGGTPGCSVAGCNTSGVDHFTSNNYVVSNDDFYPLTGGTVSGATTTGLVGGTYTVSAHYTGDGTNGASDSTPGISVTVTPEASTTTLTSEVYNLSTGLAGSEDTAYYGDAILLRADVKGSSSGQETATGSVTLSDNAASLGAFPLNTEGYTEDQTASNVDGVFTPPLAVGTHDLTASYSGDPSYGASSTSSTLVLNVEKAPTTTTVTSTPSGGNFVLTAVVDTQSSSGLSSGGSSGNAPSGTVTFFLNGTQVGSPVNLPSGVSGAAAGEDLNGFVEAQTTPLDIPSSSGGTVTATYSGDGNYTGSTSAGLSVGPTFSLVPGGGTITIASPGLSGGQVIDVSAVGGFTGTVTLTCAVTPTNLSDPPTCSFNTTAIVLTSTVTSGQSTVTVHTTAASGLPEPSSRPPSNTPWLLVNEVAAMLAGFFLLGMAGRKRRGMALLVVVLVAVVIAAANGCGGGNSSGSSNEGGTSGGTTASGYTVTVTATPSSGTPQQTTIPVSVE